LHPSCDAPASRQRARLAENHGKPSLWVFIAEPWYGPSDRAGKAASSAAPRRPVGIDCHLAGGAPLCPNTITKHDGRPVTMSDDFQNKYVAMSAGVIFSVVLALGLLGLLFS